MEAVIVDASVAIKWVVVEAGSDRARTLGGTKMEAPDLLWVECANILWKKVRRGDLKRAQALDRLALLRQAPVAIVPSSEMLETSLRLASDLAHPVYDCLYLALALQRGFPLVTADRRLAETARKHRKVAPRILLLDDLAD